MAKKNKKTLKNYFATGQLPSKDHFGDLIDSALNPIDDGFDKNAKNGLEISLVGENERLISFFDSPPVEVGAQVGVVWAIEYDREEKRLLIKRPEAEAALTFRDNGNVGLNQEHPAYALDVNGVVAARGRIGANPDNRKTVDADGKWHDIAGPLEGCHALEVIAGVGVKGSGKYALMRAVAMNAFNPRSWLNKLGLKKSIKCQQAYYMSRSDRIKLTWGTRADGYYLYMKTACSYGENVQIRYYLTELWFDPYMEESQKSDE